MKDNLGNMLNKIRNGMLAKHEVILIPYTLNNFLILKVLDQEKLIESVSIISKKKKRPSIQCSDDELCELPLFTNTDDKRYIKIHLRYNKTNNESFIKNLTRLSKPSLQVYVNYRNIPQILNGLGIIIMSTPKGIMTNKEAYNNRTGGELLFSIW